MSLVEDFDEFTPPHTNGHVPKDFLCSIIQDVKDREPKLLQFREAIGLIPSPKFEKQIKRLRKTYNEAVTEATNLGLSGDEYEKHVKDQITPLKERLPSILFSGTFSTRGEKHLLQHSGLICADLDDLGPQVESIRDLVVQDPHVLAAFVSPTGTGLKVVFRCDPEKDHYESFRALRYYMLEHFGVEVDEACKDVSRLCFVSHDPDCFIAEDAEVIPYPPEQVHAEPPKTPIAPTGLTPGDDYDQRGDWQSVLRRHGWTSHGEHHWTRPGKSRGISATWNTIAEKPNRFYVFTSSADGFEARHTYRPWHIYANLEHGGDFSKASKALYAQNYGARVQSLSQSPPSHDPDTPKPVIVQSRGLFDFQLIPRNHSSVLLGNRYLNRGDIAVLVGSSGMGKSSMSIQLATELSLNRGPFGILGNGPSRHLIIQSEDSDGDVAEVAHSIAHVLKLTPDEKTTVSQNVRVITDRVNRGLRFITTLRHHIAGFRPDFVWLNPLQAFIDGDITDSQDLGAFLREGLNSLNEPPSFAYFIVHHTTKPATGKERSERQWHEVMYDMAGGAEIINSARAILSLRATATEGEFNLVLAKRGRRAGVTRIRPDGAGTILEPVTSIPLRHAGGCFEGPEGKIPVIFWEGRDPDPVTEPAAKGGRPKKYDITQFIPIIPRSQDKAMTKAQLLKFANDFSDISETVFREVLNQGVKDGMLVRSQKSVGFVYHLHVPKGSISEEDV